MADQFNLSDTTPAAPAGRINVKWQSDVTGNVSAHAAGGVSSMSVSAFDTETTNGTTNPQGRGVVYLSDGIYQCVWSGSAWEYYHSGQRAYRPIDSQFSWLNQSTSTVSTATGGIYLLQPFGATQYLVIRKKAIPATPYTVTVKLIHTPYPIANLSVGICAGDGTKQHTLLATYNSGGVQPQIEKWNSPTSYNAAYVTISAYPLSSEIWMRISDNGTNRISSISHDGYNFRVLHTVGRTDFVTPTEVGFACKAQNASQDAGLLLVSWQET